MGEIALFSGVRSADVDAESDVRLLRMSEQELERLLRRYPRIAARFFNNLNHVLAARLMNTTEKLR